MARVALIHPASPNPAQRAQIWPPLGLCRIATYLEKHGHDVDIIQDALRGYNRDDVRQRIRDASVVGIGAMTIQTERAFLLAKEIASMSFGPIVVAGGPHFSAIGELEWPFHALIKGDGESAMLDIVENKRIGVIEGEPLDEYELINFKHLDYEEYGDHLIDGRRAISILTSRGCPNDCAFCGSPRMFGRRVIDYPLDAVVDNMMTLAHRYDIDCIRIMDDSFMSAPGRVAEFCGMNIGNRLSFACLANVKTVKNCDLDLMKAAGFVQIALGVESGSQKVLDIAGKRQSPDDICDAVGRIKEACMDVETLFMIGLPGETAETLAESIAFAKKLGADRTHSQFFTPFPGSRFYDEIQNGAHGAVIDHDFADYNHRRPVFVPSGIRYESLVDGAKEFFAIDGRELKC